LVGIEIFINTNNPLDLCSCYFPPNFNISPNLVDNVFSIISSNCIFGGDLNEHHPGWGSNRIDHHGNLIFSAVSARGLCLLNNGSPTRLNRPPFPDTVVDITITSLNYHYHLPFISNWFVLNTFMVVITTQS